MKVSELLENVRVGEINVLDVSGEPGARKLTVESRQLLPEEPRAPKRSESPARRHEFLESSSFAAYLARYGAKETVIFADPEKECVSAVLREDAKDGFETVTMKPQAHPLWRPWAALAGKRVPLEDFAQFVMENRRSVVQPDGRSLALSLSQIRASVSVEIQRGRGKNAINGLVVRTQIQGQGESRPDFVELPDTIMLKVPLYVGCERKEVELDLCVEADAEGEITVLVTAGTVAEAKVQAFDGMLSTIRAGVATLDAVVVFGRPEHGEWKYLPETQLASKAVSTAPAVYPR